MRTEFLPICTNACAPSGEKAISRRAEHLREGGHNDLSRDNTFAFTEACVATSGKGENAWNSVTSQTLERMLGYKAIAAGVTGPEIADDVVSQIG